MELFLDTANIEAIKELNEIVNIDGVTTNPSILASTFKDPFVVIKQISDILNPNQKLFVEVIASNYEDMVKEAEFINGLRDNCYAKIPVSKQGLKAIKICKEKGYKVLATAIFTSFQAYLAAANGADYLAPYVNRMNKYMDGIDETIKLQKTIWNNGFNSKVVAASFKDLEQVKSLMVNNIDAVTINDELCYKMIEHIGTNDAIKQFEEKCQNQYNRLTLK